MIDNKYVLKINVHTDIEHSVIVRTGYRPGGDVLVPEDKNLYHLQQGIYSVIFEACGYCSQEHLILIDDKAINNEYVLDIHPVSLRNKKAEFKGPLFCLSNTFENVLYDDEVEKKAAEYSFDTPGFGEEKGELCFTTSMEFSNYVNDTANISKYIKVFHIGNLDIVLISKDIDSVPHNYVDAIDAVKAKKRLNVMYQAQVHGTEPASGEGALAFISEAADGKLNDILEIMDIWVIPCCNPVGTDNFERGCNGVNINRDALDLQCGETVIMHDLFIRLMPEVVIDAHTFTRANGISSPYLDRAVLDIRISPARSKNMDNSIRKLNDKLANNTIQTLRREGIRSGYYGDSADPSTSRVFYGLFNTCAFLVESEGTRSGKMHYKRNVWCQLNAVKSLLNEIKGKSELILNTVHEARNALQQTEYTQANSIFVLKHGRSKKYFFKTVQPSFDLNGNMIDENNIIYFSKKCVALRKMNRPYGYIIPKYVEYADLMIDRLKTNGVNVSETSSAYVIPVRQLASNIICYMLDPASGDVE